MAKGEVHTDSRGQTYKRHNFGGNWVTRDYDYKSYEHDVRDGRTGITAGTVVLLAGLALGAHGIYDAATSTSPQQYNQQIRTEYNLSETEAAAANHRLMRYITHLAIANTTVSQAVE